MDISEDAGGSGGGGGLAAASPSIVAALREGQGTTETRREQACKDEDSLANEQCPCQGTGSLEDRKTSLSGMNGPMRMVQAERDGRLHLSVSVEVLNTGVDSTTDTPSLSSVHTRSNIAIIHS
jgi:hypothetical protein